MPSIISDATAPPLLFSRDIELSTDRECDRSFIGHPNRHDWQDSNNVSVSTVKKYCVGHKIYFIQMMDILFRYTISS